MSQRKKTRGQYHYDIGNQLQGEKTEKNTNTWRLNSALLNNQETPEEIKEEIKKYIDK